MRNIRDLIGNDEKVWLYLGSPETWEKFTSAAETEGFRFGDLPRDKWNFGYVVSVRKNRNMGHVPIFLWCMSFSVNNSDLVRKIDFRRYYDGEENYCCEKPHFRGCLI